MQDQLFDLAYVFGAARPDGEATFGPVLPTANAEGMQVLLDGFATTLADDEHAVMALAAPNGLARRP